MFTRGFFIKFSNYLLDIRPNWIVLEHVLVTSYLLDDSGNGMESIFQDSKRQREYHTMGMIMAWEP